MKHLVKRMTALAAALLIALCSLAGCKQVDGERIAVTINGEDYGISEASLYFYYMQYMTETGMYSIIGSLYGGTASYWAASFDDYSPVNACREDSMAMLIQTKILNKEAEKDGVTLTAEEEEKVTTATNKFMREYQLVVKNAGASKDDVATFVRENAIANKEYAFLTDGIDTVIDEELAIRKRVRGVSIMAANGEDGKPLSSDEQKAAVLKYVDDIKKYMKDGMEGSDIEDEMKEMKDVSVYSLGELAIEKPEEDEDPEMSSYEELGWSLNKGDIDSLTMVNKADRWVTYIFLCLDDNDPEFRAEAEANVLKERRKEMFEEKYPDILKKYNKIHVYEDVTGKLVINETMYNGDDVVY